MLKRIYLDYAATTPIDSEVARAMLPYFNEKFGNPGSVHWFGQEASTAIFEAREKIAKAIGAKYDEIVFTGSATEANNLALRGVLEHCFTEPRSGFSSENQPLDSRRMSRKAGPSKFASETFRKATSKTPLRLVTTAIEHLSVLETAKDLEKRYGVEVVYVPVDKKGFVDLKKLKEAINERTVLVSIIYVNNEIGTIQPIREIRKIIDSRFRGSASRRRQVDGNDRPLFHIDAVQAYPFLKCNVDELGVDLMTLSAHKIYGPKGIGALYVRKIESKLISVHPLITGGKQEWGLRAGTENVPGIAAFGKAVEITEKIKLKEAKRVGDLRDYFWKELKKIVPEVEVNGVDVDFRLPAGRHGLRGNDKEKGKCKCRAPHILNIYFPGRPSQDLCIELDLWGVAVSPGVACSARNTEPSHVIKALGYSDDRAHSSLRFSFGRGTTKKELDHALTIFKKRFNI